MRLAALGITIWLALFVGALAADKLRQEPPPKPPIVLVVSPAQNWYRTASVSAHDADTVRCDILFPWGVTLREQSIRLHGVDAWEVTKQRQTVKVTDAEVTKGKQARDEFQQLLFTGRFEVQPVTYFGTDSVYGRIEANWRVVHGDGTATDVAEWIRQAGHERK